MQPGKHYSLKQATRTVTGSISKIHYRTDVNTMAHHQADQLQLNEIGSCEVTLTAPIAFDPYRQSKGTGAFIIIDRLTNVTVGAGMITGAADSSRDLSRVTAEERAARFAQQAVTVWIEGSDNQISAYQLERKLFDSGHAATVLEEVEAPQIIAEQIVHAGLICLCPVSTAPPADQQNLVFSTSEMSAAEMLSALKADGLLSVAI